MGKVYAFGQADITLPAAQYLSVSCLDGTAKVYVSSWPASVAEVYSLATSGTVTNETQLFGTHLTDKHYRIEAAGPAIVTYATGTSPDAADFAGVSSTSDFVGESAAQGGSITIKGGTSSTTTNAGGAAALTGGTPGATGIGGAITVTSGAGGATSGVSGAVTVATGTTTTGSGSATGNAIFQSGSGAASAAAVAGGASGTVTVRSQAGGANTGGASGQVGGAGGALAITGGAGGATNSTGAHAAGAGSAVTVTAGAGGNASAGTGNGGAGGSLTLTSGTGGTSSGGTAGVPGAIRIRGLNTRVQAAPTAMTSSATVTAAGMLTRIITGTHAVGSTQTYTLPTGTLLDAAVQMDADDSFEWFLINLSAAAADTVTVAADTGHTVVGVMIVQSVHATTGGITGNCGHFLTRKTAANTYVTYRIG